MFDEILVPRVFPAMLAFLFLALGLFMSAGFQLWSYERIKKIAALRLF